MLQALEVLVRAIGLVQLLWLLLVGVYLPSVVGQCTLHNLHHVQGPLPIRVLLIKFLYFYRVNQLIIVLFVQLLLLHQPIHDVTGCVGVYFAFISSAYACIWPNHCSKYSCLLCKLIFSSLCLIGILIRYLITYCNGGNNTSSACFCLFTEIASFFWHPIQVIGEEQGCSFTTCLFNTDVFI